MNSIKSAHKSQHSTCTLFERRKSWFSYGQWEVIGHEYIFIIIMNSLEFLKLNAFISRTSLFFASFKRVSIMNSSF